MRKVPMWLAGEFQEWKRCHQYHATKKKHAAPRESTIAIQRTDLPLPVFCFLVLLAVFLTWVLVAGGTL